MSRILVAWCKAYGSQAISSHSMLFGQIIRTGWISAWDIGFNFPLNFPLAVYGDSFKTLARLSSFSAKEMTCAFSCYPSSCKVWTSPFNFSISPHANALIQPADLTFFSSLTLGCCCFACKDNSVVLFVRVNNIIITVAREISSLNWSWTNSLNKANVIFGKFSVFPMGTAETLGRRAKRTKAHNIVVQDFTIWSPIWAANQSHTVQGGLKLSM